MVAPSATTLPGGTALQSGDGVSSAPALPCGDSSLPLCPSLLSDLTSPHHSLCSVANKHNLTLDDLLIWFQRPETREAIAAREHAAYTHLRLVAAVNLSHALHATVKTLQTFNTTPTPADPLDPAYLRASIHARKAAWLLFRFSRLTPLAAPDLDAARTTLRATQPVSHLVEARPTRQAPTDERATAHTSADIEPTHAPQPSASAAPAPAPTPPDTLTSPAAPPAPEPTDLPAPPDLTAHADMSALLTHLTSLAASLGIDVSDLDDPNFDSDPFLLDHAPHAVALAAANPTDSS